MEAFTAGGVYRPILQASSGTIYTIGTIIESLLEGLWDNLLKRPLEHLPESSLESLLESLLEWSPESAQGRIAFFGGMLWPTIDGSFDIDVANLFV